MRISDWSSDLCSSDLADLGCAVALASRTEADCADLAAGIAERFRVPAVGLSCNIADEASVEAAVAGTIDRLGGLDKIGRASGRERVCQYVSISEVVVSLKNKNYTISCTST